MLAVIIPVYIRLCLVALLPALIRSVFSLFLRLRLLHLRRMQILILFFVCRLLTPFPWICPVS